MSLIENPTHIMPVDRIPNALHTIELVQVQYVNKYTDTFDRSQRRLNNTTSQSSVKRQRDENKTITNYVHIS